MNSVRVGLLALALTLVLPRYIYGHQEERPENLQMTVFARLQGGGERMEILVRTPLYLLINVGLPLQAEHQVDSEAFSREDPHVAGDATYAQRASAAVLKAIEVSYGGAPIRFSANSLTLSSSGNAAFSRYETAITHVRRGLEGSDNSVGMHRGYLDLRAIADLPARQGDLRLTANIGPDLAQSLAITVRQISPTGELHTTNLEDDSVPEMVLRHLN